MKEVEVYRLELNGRTAARVLVERPAWLPVAPRISPRSAWLRQFVSHILLMHLSAAPTCAGS